MVSKPEEPGDFFSTVLIRRADSERLKKLAKPRNKRKPHQRRLEHKYEVITRALDLLEIARSGEDNENNIEGEVLGA